MKQIYFITGSRGIGKFTIEGLQQKVAELYSQKGYNASPQTLVLGIMEELGELAMAILLTECDDFKPSSRKLYLNGQMHSPAREIGDCITCLLALCNELGIVPYFKWLDGEEE